SYFFRAQRLMLTKVSIPNWRIVKVSFAERIGRSAACPSRAAREMALLHPSNSDAPTTSRPLRLGQPRPGAVISYWCYLQDRPSLLPWGDFAGEFFLS